MTGEKAAKKPAPSGPVFLHTQVIALPAVLPGPSAAAVLAAQQAGHRVVGAPTAVVDKDKVRPPAEPNLAEVVWSVPIEAA